MIVVIGLSLNCVMDARVVRGTKRNLFFVRPATGRVTPVIDLGLFFYPAIVGLRNLFTCVFLTLPVYACDFSGAGENLNFKIELPHDVTRHVLA